VGGVGITGNLNTGATTGTIQNQLLSGTQSAPVAGTFLAGAHTVLSGSGGNYLAMGQYPSGGSNQYGQWIQSGYPAVSGAVYYPMVLNPLGGNTVVGASTASTSTTTGALVVSGGLGVATNLYAGAVYDNGNRVLTSLSSSGAGNLTVSVSAPASTTVALPATGPGVTTVGSSTSIPVITTDAYGRISALTSSAVSTTISLAAGSGSGSVAGGGTLTISGGGNVTTSVTGSTYTINSTNAGVTGLFTSGAGNVTVSSSTGGVSVTLPASGPGAVSAGSSTAIPVIATDAYGRFSTLTTAAVIAPAGTLSGTTLNSTVTASSLTSVGTLGALTVTSTITGSVSGSAATVTSASQPSITTLAGLTSFGTAGVTTTAAGNFTITGCLTVNGTTTTINNTTYETTEYVNTINATNVYAATVGNIGANMVGTGTYLTSLNASNLTTGTVSASLIPTLNQNTTGSAGSAPAGSLTGTTLASGVTASSLTSVGTLTGLTVSNSTTSNWSVNIANGSLGGTAGNQVLMQRLSSSDANANYLEITETRTATGTSWTTSATRLQEKIDATWMGFIQFNGDTNNGGITFGTGTSTVSPTSIPERVRIDSSGNMFPAANVAQTLGSSTAWWSTVYGKAVQAQYADLAENYTADAEYAPGTVVVFGGNAEITVTTTSHDTAVAGIISTNPAYLMNGATPGLPVALTGRVPCLVQGPIRKGQVLVTSNTPGVAQAIDNSQFVPGCVLGKALETINTNTIETIEVVVGRF
jgi:hypothetical protein